MKKSKYGPKVQVTHHQTEDEGGVTICNGCGHCVYTNIDSDGSRKWARAQMGRECPNRPFEGFDRHFYVEESEVTGIQTTPKKARKREQRLFKARMALRDAQKEEKDALRAITRRKRNNGD